MKQMQRGFTLIELIVVIVILGILAATALPRFIDLKSDAAAAAVKGVAAALSSGSSMNYAERSLRGTGSGHPVKTCDSTDATNGPVNLLQGGLPTGYTVDGGAISAGTTVNCVVHYTPPGGAAVSAAAPVIGID